MELLLCVLDWAILRSIEILIFSLLRAQPFQGIPSMTRIRNVGNASCHGLMSIRLMFSFEFNIETVNTERILGTNHHNV